MISLFTAIGMYFVWSSAFAIGKKTLAFSPPIFLTGFRMCLAGLLMLGFLALCRKNCFKLTRPQWFSIIVLALTSVYLANVFEFWGLQYLSSAKACFIYSLSPFFAALFSYIHFGEKLNKRKLMGLLIGLLGFIPVLKLQTQAEGVLSIFQYLSWPELALAAGALFAVYGWVILRLIVKEHTISPVVANGASMMIGGVLALIHSFFVETWNPIPIESSILPHFLGGCILLTIISNIICYNIYGFLLKRYTATFLSFIGLLSPIFASIHGYILLKEPIAWEIFLGAAIVMSGLWLVYSAEVKQGYIMKARKTLSANA